MCFSQFWSHFRRTVQCLPQRLKSMFFEIFSIWASGVKKRFQRTFILVFEVIEQPAKTHFLTFSCETKIMKITHSAAEEKRTSQKSETGPNYRHFLFDHFACKNIFCTRIRVMQKFPLCGAKKWHTFLLAIKIILKSNPELVIQF